MKTKIDELKGITVENISKNLIIFNTFNKSFGTGVFSYLNFF